MEIHYNRVLFIIIIFQLLFSLSLSLSVGISFLLLFAGFFLFTFFFKQTDLIIQTQTHTHTLTHNSDIELHAYVIFFISVLFYMLYTSVTVLPYSSQSIQKSIFVFYSYVFLLLSQTICGKNTMIF